MKDYLQKIKNNIWNHSYYEEVITKPLSSSFKYYAKMTLWLALIYTAFVSIVFLPGFIDLSRDVISGVVGSYPAELQVHFRDGKASVNMPEPIIVSLSDKERTIFKNAQVKWGVPENLFVIDTRTNFNLTEFSNYRSLMVLKKDAFAGVGSNGEVRVSNVPSGNVIISGADIKRVANKLQTAILVLAPLGVLMVYLLGVLFFILTIGYLILIALFAWLLLYIAKRNITFKQSLAVTLHASTFALLINFLIFVLYPSLSLNFPFLVTFTLLITYLNLVRKPKVTVTIPANVAVDTVAKAEEKEKEEEVKEKKD